ncbi:hypothetical protein ACWKWU_04075 [Chitinophaga lutea]
MRNSCLQILAATMLLAFAACHKPRTGEPGPGGPPPAGVVRDRGVVNGTVKKQTIGANGGRITSADGRLEVDIPAGAVTRDTEFSIEPLTNTLPGALPQSYRLRPDNMTFPKPVKLTFSYSLSEIDSTAEEALFMAYQAPDRIWRFVPGTVLSKAGAFISVETKQFADWTPYALYWLLSSKRVLRYGESTALSVRTTDNYQTANFSLEAIPIGNIKTLDHLDYLKNWRLEGDGKLTVAGYNATYTAAINPPLLNPISVLVDVVNFLPRSRATDGKAVLAARLVVTPDTWLAGTIGNEGFNATPTEYSYKNGIVHFQATPGSGRKLDISVEMGKTLKWGVFPWSLTPFPNTAIAEYLPSGAGQFYSGYFGCDGFERNSTGHFQIVRIDPAGYLEGNLEVEVYIIGVCDTPEKRAIRASFRLKPAN